MAQLLLFPDPRPLVERLGPEFFRTAPNSPGVYLMRDRADGVLYVGKAKNIRKRLASYRVANPDRLARRHLRLLHAVARIELRPCESESMALANESALLRTLRPRFNRAGTWPGTPRFLAWRGIGSTLEVAIMPAAAEHWQNCGPMGASAIGLRAALVRLLWCAVHPQAGVTGLPEGWFNGRHSRISSICLGELPRSDFQKHSAPLHNLFAGKPETFSGWILERTGSWTHPLDVAVRDADLETITDFANRLR